MLCPLDQRVLVDQSDPVRDRRQRALAVGLGQLPSLLANLAKRGADLNERRLEASSDGIQISSQTRRTPPGHRCLKYYNNTLY